MTITIPSTTVKSRYIKTLAVGTVYKDPRNNYTYLPLNSEIKHVYTNFNPGR